MPKIKLVINERDYFVNCKAGEEERLLECAAHFDRYAAQNASAIKKFGETHVMVMAALMCVDEIFDLRQETEALKEQIFEVQKSQKEQTHKSAKDKHALKTLESLRARIEKMAERWAPLSAEPTPSAQR